jgi:hypothetical protein
MQRWGECSFKSLNELQNKTIKTGYDKIKPW